MPLRLALIVGQLQMGGAERQLYELAVRLDRARFDPFVVCLSGVVEPFGARLRESGVPVETLARSGHRDWGRARRLAGILGERGAGLAHSFLLAANAYTWAATRFTGRRIPYVASSRTCIPPRGFLALRAHRRAFGAARMVIANSRRVMEFTRDLYRIAEERLRVVPNGVDLARFDAVGHDARASARAGLRLPEAAIVAGSVGRLSPEKNVGLFLEMAARIAAADARLVFVLVGDGPEMPALKTRAERLGLGQRVVFAGAREQVAGLLPAFDLFVSSSDTEGMPNAVMEAMAAGLPVVATRVGGTEEVIRDGDTGHLIDRGDLEALVERVRRLASDPNERTAMGRRGRARIEREFTVELMAAATMAVYDEALA